MTLYNKYTPKAWARKDELLYVSTQGTLLCALYPKTDGRADLEPIYDRAAIDAAVVEERERCARIVDVNPATDARDLTGGQEGMDMLRELAVKIRANTSPK